MNIPQPIRTGLSGLFIITHPILGIATQPVWGLKAAVHAFALKYHFHKTKNEQGVPLSRDPEKPYVIQATKFESSDLPRLLHEKKRLEAEQSLTLALIDWRAFAKLIIPVVGLIWAYKTEKRQQPPSDLLVRHAQVQYHISKLSEKK